MIVQYTENFAGKFAGQKVVGSVGEIAELSDDVGADVVRQGFAVRIDEPEPTPVKRVPKKVL